MDDRSNGGVASTRKKRTTSHKPKPERNQNLNFKLKLNKEGVLIDRNSDSSNANQFSFQLPRTNINAAHSPRGDEDTLFNEKHDILASVSHTSNDQLYKMNINYIVNVFVFIISILCLLFVM